MWKTIGGWIVRQVGRGIAWAIAHPENAVQAAKIGKAIVGAVKDSKAKDRT